jgi:hypothetical protein
MGLFLPSSKAPARRRSWACHLRQVRARRAQPGRAVWTPSRQGSSIRRPRRCRRGGGGGAPRARTRARRTSRSRRGRRSSSSSAIQGSRSLRGRPSRARTPRTRSGRRCKSTELNRSPRVQYRHAWILNSSRRRMDSSSRQKETEEIDARI